MFNVVILQYIGLGLNKSIYRFNGPHEIIL